MNEQQPAYVLHCRPWRETSVIADLFTLNDGRVSAIVHGARKPQGKKPAKQALIQPFTPLMVSFSGGNELRTCVQLDAAGPPLGITGNCLYSGLYANELLLNLLAAQDPHSRLFAYYQTLLNGLMDNPILEQSLRPFEVHLMDELGYHMVLDKDYLSAHPVESEKSYKLVPLQGVCLIDPLQDDSKVPAISGAILLELAFGNYTNSQCLKVAKYMARANLNEILGGKPLQSRNFFSGSNTTI